MSPSAATCSAPAWRLRAEPRHSQPLPEIAWRFYAPDPAPVEMLNVVTRRSAEVLLAEPPLWHPLVAAAAEFPNRWFSVPEFVPQEFLPWGFVREDFAAAALSLLVLRRARCELAVLA